MDDHISEQRDHYSTQYAEQGIALECDHNGDLWEWAKWYPLLVFDGFVETLKGKSLVDICCGAGRELGLFNKYGVNVTATDLTVEHLEELVNQDVIGSADIQNAERLAYPDESFDYGFVNAGLHHLQHPHAGLCELLRTARQAAIFIESQDSLLHSVTRMLGRHGPDYEPAGNYVYRWKRREVEKIALSAHADSYAIKTSFLPISTRMRGVSGRAKRFWQAVQAVTDRVLGRVGNLMIVIIFKRPPTPAQHEYLRKAGFTYRETRPPEDIVARG